MRKLINSLIEITFLMQKKFSFFYASGGFICTYRGAVTHVLRTIMVVHISLHQKKKKNRGILS